MTQVTFGTLAPERGFVACIIPIPVPAIGADAILILAAMEIVQVAALCWTVNN